MRTKFMVNSALTVVLASGVIAVNSFAASDGEKEQCVSQVAEVYGSDGEVNYVGERRFRDGTRMQYAVHEKDPATGYSTTKLAVCWLANENYQAFSADESETMVADVDVSAAVPTEPLLD